MRAPKSDGRGNRQITLEGVNHVPEACGRTNRSPASVGRVLIASLAAALAGLALQSAAAAEPSPVRIALFDFELNDASAGGGIIAQDAIDTENLKEFDRRGAPHALRFGPLQRRRDRQRGR